MALEVGVGTFESLTTDSVGTTYTVTVGFQPVAGIVFTVGRGGSADANGVLTSRRCVGFFTSTTNRVCEATMSVHGAAAGSGGLIHANDAVVKTQVTDSTTVDGAIDVDAILSTGVRFIVDDVLPVNTRIGVMCFGGADLTNATIVEFNAGAAGSQQVTTIGFQGTVLFLLGAPNGNVAPTVRSDRATMYFGAATSAADEHVLSNGMDQGSAAADTGSYCRAGEVAAVLPAGVGSPSATGMENRATFTQWLSNGFEINWVEMTTTNYKHFAMVLQGGSWTVGDFLTLTTVDTIVESGFGYTPKGVIVLSDGKTEPAADDLTVDDRWTFGVADGSTQHAQAIIDDDGPQTMNVATGTDFDKVYKNMTVGGSIEGLISVTTFDSDGITFTQDDADVSAYFAWYIACGNAAAAVASSPYYSSYYSRVVAGAH